MTAPTSSPAVDLEPFLAPTAFIESLTGSGFLGALIPEEYGGSGS